MLPGSGDARRHRGRRGHPRGWIPRARSRSRCSAMSCARRIRSSPRATRCAPCCSSRTSWRASYPLLERGSSPPAPPPAPRTDAAFLEIADPPGERGVPEMLDGLGFSRAGQHRSKPVTWWRNGDAHVVVNNDRTPARDGPHATALGVDRTTGRGRGSTSGCSPVAGGRHHPRGRRGNAARHHLPVRTARLRQRHPRPRQPLAARLRARRGRRRTADLAAASTTSRSRCRRAAERGDGVLPHAVRPGAGRTRGVHGAAREAAQHCAATSRRATCASS